MSFAHPIVLIALTIPILLIVFQWIKRTRALPLPFDYQKLKDRKWLGVLLNIVNTLPHLILAALILIAAAPSAPESPAAPTPLPQDPKFEDRFVAEMSGWAETATCAGRGEPGGPPANSGHFGACCVTLCAQVAPAALNCIKISS